SWPFLPLGRARGVDFRITEGRVGALLAATAVLLRVVFLIAPAFDRFFEAFTRLYERALHFALRWRGVGALALAARPVPTFFAFRRTGQELFPDVDSGEFTVHMRASGGPRVEETERMVGDIEKIIRGYQGTGKDLVREVLRGRQDKDQARLDALLKVGAGSG